MSETDERAIRWHYQIHAKDTSGESDGLNVAFIGVYRRFQHKAPASAGALISGRFLQHFVQPFGKFLRFVDDADTRSLKGFYLLRRGT